MLKKILIALGLIIVVLAGVVFYLVNPYDPQYKSFYTERKAMYAFKKGDVDTFIKYMNNPVTVKYHAPMNLYLTLAYTGKYDEAEKAVQSYVKFKDYSVCAQYKIPGRLFCRVTDIFFPVQKPQIDKNHWLSIINFEKGDYKKAEEYNLKSKKQSACYNTKLYAALGNYKKADKYLGVCEQQFAHKEIKNALYRTKGFYYLQKKKYDVAEDYLKKSIIAPKRAEFRINNSSYLLLAELYTKMNKPQQARHYYELVLKTDPYSYKAQKGVGLIKK